MRVRGRVLAGALMLYALTSPAAELTTASLDGGGGRSTGGTYVNDACVGGIGGVSSGGADVARQGFAGQLMDVSRVSVTGTPARVNEQAATQLGGAATMDDDTVTVLAGGELAWSAPAWPIASIGGTGVATAGVVYADTTGTVAGRYDGVAGSGTLRVLDVDHDNYGSYAADGLPDNWQVAYFGVGNPKAGPDKDPDGDGQDNRFEWIAGLVPTNAASRFTLRLEKVAGSPHRCRLVFAPRWTDRTYMPLCSAALPGAASWPELTTQITSDNGTERTVTDTNAVERSKLYRVRIAVP